MRVEAFSDSSSTWAGSRVLLRAMTLANFEGRVGDALAALEGLAAMLPDETCPWICVSAMIDTLIMAGRYREALALPDTWSSEARERGARQDREYFVLARVNAAEALYNVGRVSEAAQLVETLAAECECAPRDSYALAGVCVQQAWIAALMGQPERTLGLLEQPRELPADYRAELHYTRALALGLLDRHAAARREAERGFRLAVRVSSFRNGLFLQGVLAQRAGELRRALVSFEAGAAHPYREQGGAALLCYGDTLARLGRDHEAQTAWRWVLERDPQSSACADARMRLTDSCKP